MMLVARIATSDETDERVLELAARVVELQQIELGLDDTAADLGATVLARRQREREATALLVRLGDLRDAIDRLQDAGDLRLVAGVTDGDRDLANLALVLREVGFAADAEERALAEDQQTITRLADLGEAVARDQNRVV